MHSLPLFVRLSGRPVILLGDGEAADAKRRLLERAGALVVADPDAAASLAIVALPDAEAEAAANRLRARGLLINVVDRPDLCDFTTPAIVDRDPVLIAIGTGGASAGLAAALRQRLEAWLPERIGALAHGLYAARAALRERWPTAAARQRAIGAALASGGALDPLDPAAPDRLAGWLEGTDSGARARLEHLRLTSADPEELTLRAARLLGLADDIWHDGSVPDAILDRARADAVRMIAAAPPAPPVQGLRLWLEFAR